ncbi:hypothetical protein FRC04_007353 [Tulasnella sp. 424]|nr:hypothetical protein FRC04_007353 [Tulasnella sp. 424]
MSIKEPPSTATPKFSIPEQEAASLLDIQGFNRNVPIALYLSVWPLAIPGSLGQLSRSMRKLRAVDELDAFRGATQGLSANSGVRRSSSSTLVAIQVEKTFPSTSPASSPSRDVSQMYQTPRHPSSSPVARSAPPTTPSPTSLP